MTTTIAVSGKTLGRREPLFADWSMAYPPNLPTGGGGITLRDLITRVVHSEIESFRTRQQERRCIRALTAREIQRGADAGKIDMGGHDLRQNVDEEQSVHAAIEAYEDGLYLVVVDGRQQRELDAEVYLRPDSSITFIRLTMLAGG